MEGENKQTQEEILQHEIGQAAETFVETIRGKLESMLLEHRSGNGGYGESATVDESNSDFEEGKEEEEGEEEETKFADGVMFPIFDLVNDAVDFDISKVCSENYSYMIGKQHMAIEVIKRLNELGEEIRLSDFKLGETRKQHQAKVAARKQEEQDNNKENEGF
jgi:hypothetical protein